MRVKSTTPIIYDSALGDEGMEERKAPESSSNMAIMGVFFISVRDL